MVESGGLENRCVGNPCSEGSNPSPSASSRNPASAAGLRLLSFAGLPVAVGSVRVGQSRPGGRLFPPAFPRSRSTGANRWRPGRARTGHSRAVVRVRRRRCGTAIAAGGPRAGTLEPAVDVAAARLPPVGSMRGSRGGCWPASTASAASRPQPARPKAALMVVERVVTRCRREAVLWLEMLDGRGESCHALPVGRLCCGWKCLTSVSPERIDRCASNQCVATAAAGSSAGDQLPMVDVASMGIHSLLMARPEALRGSLLVLG